MRTKTSVYVLKLFRLMSALPFQDPLHWGRVRFLKKLLARFILFYRLLPVQM